MEVRPIFCKPRNHLGIIEALVLLTRRQQLIYKLHYRQRMNHRQIAERLCCSRSSVTRILTRARARIEGAKNGIRGTEVDPAEFLAGLIGR